ncbi:MAG: hypothetical protein FWE01_01530 [Firmicutes bacterium]|nr:hypothetical protein [Bacillota bacterium]
MKKNKTLSGMIITVIVTAIALLIMQFQTLPVLTVAGHQIPADSEAIMVLSTDATITIDLSVINTTTFELPVSLWIFGNAELAMADARILFDPNVFQVDRIEVNTLIVGIPGVFEMPISQNYTFNNTLGQINKGFSNVNAMPIFAPGNEYYLGDIIFRLRDDVMPGTYSINFETGPAFTSVNPHADIAIQHDYANGRLALGNLDIVFEGETTIFCNNAKLDRDNLVIEIAEEAFNISPSMWTSATTLVLPYEFQYIYANDFRLRASPESNVATISIDGGPHASYFDDFLSLSTGTTTIVQIEIVAQDQITTEIYTVAITLDAPVNPLDSVEIYDIIHAELVINRDGGTNIWNTITLPFTTTQIEVMDFEIVATSGATVSFEQSTVSLQSVALPNYSTTPITFTITSASGNFFATHTINVIRNGGDSNTNITGFNFEIGGAVQTASSQWLNPTGTNAIWNILEEIPLSHADAITLTVSPESSLSSVAITLNGMPIDQNINPLEDIQPGSNNVLVITTTPQFGNSVVRTIQFFVRTADLGLTYLTITPTPTTPSVFPPVGLLANQFSTPVPINVILPHGTDNFTIAASVVNIQEASITSGLGTHNIDVLPGVTTPIIIRIDGEDGTFRNIDLNVTVAVAVIDMTAEWTAGFIFPSPSRSPEPFFFVGETYHTNAIRLVLHNSDNTTTVVNVSQAMAITAGFPVTGFATPGTYTLNFEHSVNPTTGLPHSVEFIVDVVIPNPSGINLLATNTTFNQFAAYDNRFQIYITHDWPGANNSQNPITVTIDMLGGLEAFENAVSVHGSRQLVIYYQGFTIDVPITVIAANAIVNGISAQWTPGFIFSAPERIPEPFFFVGESFPSGAIQIVHHYTDGSSSAPIPVTASMANNAGFNTSIPGITTLQFTHANVTEPVTMSAKVVAPIINGIELVPGANLTFTQNAPYDNRFSVFFTHNWSGANNLTNSIPVTASMITGFNTSVSVLGPRQLVIEYAGFSLTVDINVVAPVAVIYRISAEWATIRDRHNFVQGEPYQNNAIEIIAHWTDDRVPTRIPVTTAMAMTAGFDTSSQGQMILNLTHLAHNYPFVVSVIVAQITEIRIMNVGTTTFTRGSAYDNSWQFEFIWNWRETPDTGHAVTLAMMGDSFNTNDLGNVNVTISHLGFTSTRQITVIAPANPNNVNIFVINNQSRNTWMIGEAFDQEAIVIQVNINDTYIYNTSVTLAMIGGISTWNGIISTPGIQTLVITYLDTTTTFQITVNAAPEIPTVESISVMAGSRVGWIVGQSYVTGEIRILVTMSDTEQRQVDVTLAMLGGALAWNEVVATPTGPGMLRVLTITYQDTITQFNIIVLPSDIITDPTEDPDYRALDDLVLTVAGIMKPWNGERIFEPMPISFHLRHAVVINAISTNPDASVELVVDGVNRNGQTLPILPVGVSTFNIVVVSPAGNTQTYSVVITVNELDESDIDPYRSKLHLLVSFILGDFDWQSIEPDDSLDVITLHFRNLYSEETVEPFLEWLGISIFLLMEWDANGSYSYETAFNALTNTFAALEEKQDFPSPDLDDDDRNFFMDNLHWILIGVGTLAAVILASTFLYLRKRKAKIKMNTLNELKNSATQALDKAMNDLRFATGQASIAKQESKMRETAMDAIQNAGDSAQKAVRLAKEYKTAKKGGKK